MTKTRSDDPRTAVEAQRRRIALKGVEAAVSALIGVCEDPRAAAPAKATAGSSLLRAAGMFDRNADCGTDKSPADMTPEELSRAIEDITRRYNDQDEADEEESAEGSPNILD